MMDMDFTTGLINLAAAALAFGVVAIGLFKKGLEGAPLPRVRPLAFLKKLKVCENRKFSLDGSQIWLMEAQ
jgi:hypothetical protein